MITALPILLMSFLPIQDPPETGWSGSADAGLIWIDGNNKSVTSNVDAAVKYLGDGYRLLFGGKYSGVRQEDPVTQDASSTARLYQLTAAYNRFLDDEDNLYVYGNAAARQDKPNGLDIREQAGVGAGYTWRWQEDKSELSAEAGPSVLKENNVGAPTGDAALNGRLAANATHPFAEDWTLFGNGEFLQSFDESDDRIATGELGVRWNMGETWYLKATAGVAWDNTPAPGFKKTDYRYTLAVGTTF